MTDTDRITREAMKLFEQIRPLLAGRGREMQSAVVVQMLGYFLASIQGDSRKLARIVEVEMLASAALDFAAFADEHLIDDKDPPREETLQ